MRKVIIAKDENYAASKVSDVNGSATLAVDLKVGAIGIYGIPNTSANNKEKMALITNGGADAGGKVPDASFDGIGVHIAVGTAIGCQTSGEIDIEGVVKYKSQAYVAPVAQVIDIAELNLPATVNQYDSATLRIVDQENYDQGGAIKAEVINFNYAADAGDGSQAVVAGICAAAEAHPQDWVRVKGVSTTSGVAVTNNATVTNGSKTVTSTAHGVGVDDFVSIDGDVYKVVAVPDANTMTLGRNYSGPSGTVLAANVLDLGAALDDNGLQIISLKDEKNFAASVMGLLENAVIVYTTPGTAGHGNPLQVAAMEEEVRGYKGSTAGATDRMMPFEDLHTDPATNYDVYVFTVKNPPQASTGGTAVHAHNLYTEIVCAFPESPSNDGQSDFEAILAQVLYGAADLGGI